MTDKEMVERMESLVRSIMFHYKPSIVDEVYQEFLRTCGNQILELSRQTRGLGRIPSTRFLEAIEELETVVEKLKIVGLEASDGGDKQ